MSMCKPFLSLFVKTLKTRCIRRRQISPPVPPPGELENTGRLWFWPIRSIRPVKTWRYSQNRKYIGLTYCTAARGEPSHGHRSHVQKIRWNLDLCFWRMRANRQTDKQTARQTYRIADLNIIDDFLSCFCVCVKNSSRRLGLWIL